MIPLCFVSLLFGPTDVYHNNVVVLLDNSGSMDSQMSGTRYRKIDLAKNVLKSVLSQVPKTTQIGLVTFGDDKVADLPPSRPEILDRIDQISVGGNTPLGRYMKVAADDLLAKRSKQMGYGSYRLVIVTDGEASDSQLVKEYTPDILARGITVDVIGVDMDEKHVLAKGKNGKPIVHSFRHVKDVKALQASISESLAEVKTDVNDGADTFADIQPLPTEMVSAMIKSLSTSGNHPIGTKGEIINGRAQVIPSGRSWIYILFVGVFGAIVVGAIVLSRC